MKRGSPLRRTPLKRGTKPLRAKPYRDPIPPEVTDALYERSGGMCEVTKIEHGCTGRAVHRHHILRQSQGGGHTLDNLLHCCAKGHLAVHLNPALSYALEYLRRRAA